MAKSAISRLRQETDFKVTMVVTALFHNPTPYYIAASMHQVTRQIQMPPQAHIRQVVRRLRLCPQQLRHLAIISSEFGRLSRDVSKEGNKLAEQAAKLSLASVLPDSHQQDTAICSGNAFGMAEGTQDPDMGTKEGTAAAATAPIVAEDETWQLECADYMAARNVVLEQQLLHVLSRQQSQQPNTAAGAPKGC
eukprot:gene3010-3290_t